MAKDLPMFNYGAILQSIPDWMDGLEVKLVLQSGAYAIESIIDIEESGLLRAKETGRDVFHVFPLEKLELTISQRDSD